jgi:DNA-binding beta-propeller fold protein YncE
VDRTTAGNYNRYQVIRIWWPMEDYKNLTWERIGYALTHAQMRTALWNIFWARDYSLYSQLTGQTMDPPRTWPLQDSMRVYIRKDVPAQSLHLNLAPFQLSQAAPAVNPYASVAQNLTPAAELQPAGLNRPRNLVFAPDGSLYVLDTGNSRVIKLSKEGNLLFTLGGPLPAGATQAAGAVVFNQPWGITLDAKSNLYVADTWNHRILKFDGNGRFLLAWGVGGQAADGPDRLWGPRAIAAGPDGNLYITDTGNKRVVVYSSNGKFLFQFPGSGQAQLNEPVGIAFGPDEKVYVADTWNQRVVVFKADGTFVNAWPVQGWIGNSLDNKPYLAVDASGRVYLTDPESSRVVVFSPDGKPLASFGEFGSSPAGMILPTGITIGPDGYAWMMDTGNNRVVAYRLNLPKP